MNQLLHVVDSWLGYLERPGVVAQLLAVLLLCLASRWLNRRWLAAGLALTTLLFHLAGLPSGLVLLVLVLIAGWWGLALLRRLLARTLQPRQLQQLDSRLIRPGYLLLAAFVLVRQLDNPWDLGLIPLGSWFGTPVNLGEALASIGIVYLLAMGTGPPAEALAWLLQRGLDIGDGSRRAMALMIRYVVVALGVLWALDHVGFNRTGILAIAGGLSVGLGFGIKEVFSNFVSGLWLLFEGSVRPGEVLFIDGDPCEVIALGLRATTLWRDRDNAELVIPNQTFFTTAATTYTGRDRLRRSQITVGAAYRHDPQQVMAVLEGAARAIPEVMRDPQPRAFLLHYGDSAMIYALRFWIADPMQNVSLCSQVQDEVWRAFRRHGIEIPYPQQVQHAVAGTPQDPAAAVRSPSPAPAGHGHDLGGDEAPRAQS